MINLTAKQKLECNNNHVTEQMAKNTHSLPHRKSILAFDLHYVTWFHQWDLSKHNTNMKCACMVGLALLCC